MKKIFKWIVIVILVAYAVLVVYRGFVLRGERATTEQVQKIHASKITLADVMGDNLPPVPKNPDATVEGVDANKNGVRDDVELAIFEEYPDSAKTRAVLLQYAHALQMEVTQPIVNTGTVIAVAKEGSQAAGCLGDAIPKINLREFIKITEEYTNFVKKKQINTQDRDNAQRRFYEKLDSYSDLENTCDIDLSTLHD